VLAIDRADDSVDTSFRPDITGVEGDGVWAVHDAGDYLWVGGGISAVAPVSANGLFRFPASADQPVDVSAPMAPTGLQAPMVADDEVQLQWGGSIDDSGALYYRIRRDGVLVGTAATPTFVDVTAVPASTVTYAVEAVDAAQNVSGTAQLVVATLPPLTDLAAFRLGHTWNYLDSALPGAGWELDGFDDAAWEIGAGQFGRNDGDEATVIDHPPAPSVAVYFRTEFDVPVGMTAVIATLDYLRDDGVIVRVNGVEVLRDNMPAGPVDEITRALAWESANESTVFSVPIDASPFVNDTQAPTQPTGLQITGVTQTSASFDWVASTDDQGVAGYEILRDGAVVGFSPTTSHTDIGLAASTIYSYGVRAVDAAGNQSPLPVAVSATTDDLVPDVLPPSRLAAPIITDTSVALTWGPSTDGVGVTGYHVWRDGVLVASVASESLVDTALASSTTFTYAVVAHDAAGNLSPPSADLVIVTLDPVPVVTEVIAFGSTWAYDDNGVYPGNDWALGTFNGPGSSDLPFDLRADLTVGVGGAADVTPPSQPTGVVATNVTSDSLQLSWVVSTDDTAIAGYDVFRDGSLVATVGATGFNDSGLTADTAYDYEAEAFDAAGNRSARSVVLTVTTAAAPPVESDLLAMGSVWSYPDTGLYPGGSWVDPLYDAAAWVQGPAVLAANEPGATAWSISPRCGGAAGQCRARSRRWHHGGIHLPVGCYGNARPNVCAPAGRAGRR
ncbi:MAG: hypothetical protein P8N02_16130, partial [Actinomycetota bacterium]|nr:hypothetical protein [Actinomycetota bacterium]